jgi:hypothetical protein
MLVPGNQYAGQKNNITIDNNSFETVAKFKYFITPNYKKKSRADKIRGRTFHSVLFFYLQSININIKV